MEMPRLGGIDVARQTRQISPHTKIIFLTAHKDRDLFQSAINAGATGYLLKDDDPEIILEGLRAASAGRTYFSSALTAEFAIQPTSSTKSPFDLLTSTERYILKMISSGKTSREIGKALSLHYRTIENHRTNICRKLQINGPNALIRFALDRSQYL
jgi:DNA-binding NarL/FixJ family response regulator